MNSFTSPEVVASLRYRELNPLSLSDAELHDLNRLLALSVQHDYGLSGRDAMDFAFEAHAKDIQRQGYMPGGKPGTTQKYTRQHLYVAYDAEGPQASMLVANNASQTGEADEVKTRLMIEAKLHIPIQPLTRARWHWLGMRALSPKLMPEELPEVSTDPGTDELAELEFDVMDALQFIALNQPFCRAKFGGQGVSSWPWDKETWWQYSLKTWGLQPTDDKPRAKKILDGIPVTAREQRWTNPRLGNLLRNIKAKKGFDELLPAVIANSMS